MSLLGTAPGSTFELPRGSVTDAPKRSLCVKRLRISAPAALKLLCPDEYSGNGGGGEVGGRGGKQVAPPGRFLAWCGAGPARPHLAAERGGDGGGRRTEGKARGRL